MIKFSSQVFRMFVMTINNNNEKRRPRREPRFACYKLRELWVWMNSSRKPALFLPFQPNSNVFSFLAICSGGRELHIMKI